MTASRNSDMAGNRYYVPPLNTFAGGDQVASLGEKAYYLLREKIVCLELKPGDTIREHELMADLQVGRTPIREALQRLARDHLITLAPQRGAFVRELSLTDLARITEIRVQNCGLAARLAAERATASQRADLQRMLARIRKLGIHPDQRTMMRLSHRIHALVADASNNEFLAELLDRYYHLSLRVWFMFMDQISKVRAENPEHPAIAQYTELLEALLAGDADRAEQAMRHHIQDWDKDVRRVL
jgi:DNA-binding GntR family transcriptional regulator